APETRQVLQSTGNLEDLRERLSKDLNLLLDRDLAARKRLNLLQQEKAELDQKVTDGSTSESLHRKQDELAKEIAKLSQVNPLYDPERFKHVQISEYLQDFIQQNPQSH